MKTKLFYLLLLMVIWLPSNAKNNSITKDSTGCTAHFTYGIDSIHTTSYQFYGTATGTAPFQYNWNFGDGNYSNLQNPLHVFNSPGNYNVCLTISTADSCSSSYCAIVSVDSTTSGNCHAMFHYYADSLNNNRTLQFIDASIGNINSWSWDFGDGNYSNLQDPVHTFNNMGNYNVCLNITTFDSCFSSYCAIVSIDSTTSGNCQAMFYSYADSLNNNRTLQFVDASIGNVNSWSWNFGDGNYSNLQNPTHTFNNMGNYYVCLNITTTDSCFSSYCAIVSIDSTTSGNCHAMFYAVADSNIINNTYHFIDASTGNINRWSWNFGDGSTSTIQNPTHAFNQNGTFQVCLTITGSDSLNNCSDTYCQNITIGNPSTSYSLSGQVTADSLPIDAGIVNVYSVDSTYIFINSTIIDSMGYYHFVLPQGRYIVRAELSPNSIYFGHYAPTYHTNALNWQQATIINLKDHVYYANVGLIRIDSFPGAGSIGGRLLINNKNITTSNAEILLVNQSNQPVCYTKTNNSGNFTLNNLSLNNYKVYAEIPGCTSTNVPVTLTQSNQNVTGVVISLIPTAITKNSINATSVTNIYPNPVIDLLNIETNISETKEVVCCIYNSMGVKVDSKTIQMNKGVNNLTFDTKLWAKGIYLLTINSSDKTISEIKKVIK